MMSLAIDLCGRCALVTGGAGGIGQEIARTLGEAGARVVLADVDATRLADLKALGYPVQMDITDPNSVRAALAKVTTHVGPVDILVNNAGIQSSKLGMPFTNQEKADWERVLGVNIIGMFVISREIALQMVERQKGVIINIASVSGRTGFQTDPAYSASKAAVINFTQVMARDLAPYIRVNCICPGMVPTPFYRLQYEHAAAQDPTIAAMTAEEYFEQKAKRLIPLRRGQQPRDIAVAVAFLASDLAANITGQALNVDGGLVMC
jgi:2-hydroxycyclohexanecarboxyl-CoA dehydrogenase